MNRPNGMARAAFRPVWIGAGCVALVVGALGVVLPVLPTTPFVIFAAFAFGKGWPRCAALLESHRVFGPIIADWNANGAIAPRYKAMSVIMMGGALALSVWMGVPRIVLAVQTLAIFGAASFILTRPNGRSDAGALDQSASVSRDSNERPSCAG